MPNVAFVRKDLTVFKPIYQLIRDCLNGEIDVKDRETKYLPQPNATDTSDENEARYNAYLKRAVFYNVTGRTLRGFTGQVFSKEPLIEVPTQLEVVKDNINGNGVNAVQSSKKALAYVLAYGRAGLFIDYPTSGDAVTVEQLESGDVRPTVNLYKPETIINWRTKTRGARSLLSLVVLAETYVSYDDGFEMKESTQYRVLRLGQSAVNNLEGIIPGDDIYTVEIWRTIDGGNSIAAAYQPKDASGNFLNEIPFVFIGAENNDSEIDNAPLYDLASLNIAHYRNSADYEEACFIMGQATPYFAGLTEEWVKDILNSKVQLGSRAAVPLPVGGTAGLLQANANSMPKEAMDAKERQMVALGAKLVEQATVQRTATEAALESASENSTLSSSTKNVSTAYKQALDLCAAFVGVESASIEFELNSEFDLAAMTTEDRKQTILEWQGGAIAYSEMREGLRKAGIATLDDDVAKGLIDNELENSLNLSKKDVDNGA